MTLRFLHACHMREESLQKFQLHKKLKKKFGARQGLPIVWSSPCSYLWFGRWLSQNRNLLIEFHRTYRQFHEKLKKRNWKNAEVGARPGPSIIWFWDLKMTTLKAGFFQFNPSKNIDFVARPELRDHAISDCLISKDGRHREGLLRSIFPQRLHLIWNLKNQSPHQVLRLSQNSHHLRPLRVTIFEQFYVLISK